jgi:hypothetical protein
MSRADGRADGRIPPGADPAPARAIPYEAASRRWALRAARIAATGGLAVSGYVHIDLASTYAEGGGLINEGALFRVAAVAALLAAIAVALTGRRASYLAGFAVALSTLTAMLVSRYVDLGAIGPFPDLYDPVWFPEKLLAAYAEGAASLAALTGAILSSMARKSPAVAVRRSSSHLYRRI